MVGVRKIMDWIFTQSELAELDDILPELVKREKHDKKKKAEEEKAKAEKVSWMYTGEGLHVRVRWFPPTLVCNALNDQRRRYRQN